LATVGERVLKRDYATTYLTEALIVVSYLLSFRLIAARLGPPGFAEYALSRRSLSILSPLVLLSLDLSVARFASFASIDDRHGRRGYLTAALVMMLAAVAVVSPMILLFPQPISQLVFGSGQYRSLVISLPALLLGLCLNNVVGHYLRGCLRIQVANVMFAINQAVIPLAAIGFGGGDVGMILLEIGAAWTVVSLLFLGFIGLDARDLRRHMRELASYGFPRVPGDFLQLALFSIPAFLVAHLASLREAGLVAFGIAGLGLVASALSPISFVLLPNASRLVASGSVGQLRRQVQWLSWTTVGGLFLITVFFELLSRPIISAYLGPQFLGGEFFLRIVLLGAIPWGLFVTLRSVLDARHTRAYNTRNLGFGLCLFVALSGLGLAITGSSIVVIVAFVASLYLVAALTVVQAYRVVRSGAPSGGDTEPAPDARTDLTDGHPIRS
jgi:O-antigen/teichoic acid export membrane protein